MKMHRLTFRLNSDLTLTLGVYLGGQPTHFDGYWMGRTFYITDLEIQKVGIWKKNITILFGIKNNPYIPIVSLVGVGVGEVFERKN